MSTRDWTPEPWYDDKGYRIYGPITPGIDSPHHPERWLLCEFKPYDGQPGDSARAVACVNACAGMDDPAKEIAALREALRAAEAECSEWRAEFATYGPDGQANDTIRANLGLPKIGGGQ